jgi:hypothetical protein
MFLYAVPDGCEGFFLTDRIIKQLSPEVFFLNLTVKNTELQEVTDCTHELFSALCSPGPFKNVILF